MDEEQDVLDQEVKESKLKESIDSAKYFIKLGIFSSAAREYKKAAEIVKAKHSDQAVKYYVESAKLLIKDFSFFEAAKAYESAGYLLVKTNPKKTIEYFKRAIELFDEEADADQRFLDKNKGEKRKKLVPKLRAERRDKCKVGTQRLRTEIKKLKSKTKLTR